MIYFTLGQVCSQEKGMGRAFQKLLTPKKLLTEIKPAILGLLTSALDRVTNKQ